MYNVISCLDGYYIDGFASNAKTCKRIPYVSFPYNDVDHTLMCTVDYERQEYFDRRQLLI